MSKKTKKIIVNSLSASRIIGALFLPLIFSKLSIPILITFLTFLFITDFLDGLLARKFQVQTLGGSLLDPIGDKLLAVMCICSLAGIHQKLLFLLLIEFLIASLNFIRFMTGDKVDLAFVGKVKTWALSITLVLASLDHFNPNIFVDVLAIVNIKVPNLVITKGLIDTAIYITFGMELTTFFVYSKDAIRNLKKKKKKFKKKIDIKKFLKRAFNENYYKVDKDKTFSEIINSLE